MPHRLAEICVNYIVETGVKPLLKLPGIFVFHPTIANYPQAKFPGVVVFSEIYQGKNYMRTSTPPNSN